MAKITITITVTDPTHHDDLYVSTMACRFGNHALEYLRQDAQGYFDGSAVELTYNKEGN